MTRNGLLLATAGIGLALVVYFLAPLIAGRPVSGHDSGHHHAVLDEFRDGLAEGHWYPRWTGRPNWGFGAATFYFYPPLGYYAAALGTAVTGDPNTGFQLIAMLAALLGAAGVYRLLRRETGPMPASVGAALWLLMPYPQFTFFHRFAWAELLALAWMPWLLGWARDIVGAPRPAAFVRLVIGFVGLAATHLLSAVIVCPGVALYLAYEAWRRRSAALVELTVLGALGAVLVGAIFLAPVALDRHRVNLAHTQSGFHHYPRHFLFHDEFAAGYGAGYAKGGLEPIAVVTLATLLWAAVVLLATGRLRGRVAFLLAAASGLFYLSTGASEPVWRLVPPLTMVQFPSRLLGPVSVLAVWLLGIALAAAGRRLTVATVLVAGLPAALSVVNLTTAFDDTPAADPDGNLVVLEYMPRTVHYESLIDYIPLATRAERMVVASGDARVALRERRTHAQRFEIRAGAAGAVVIPLLFDYPGWTARLDGEPIAGDPVPRLGLRAYRIPAGDHSLALTHEAAPSRTLGAWLSLAGLLLVPCLSLRARRRVIGPAGARLRGRTVGLAGAVVAVAAIAAPFAFPFPRVEPSMVLITVSGLRAEAAADNAGPPFRARFPQLAGLMRFHRSVPDGETPAAAAARWLIDTDAVSDLRRNGRVAAFLETDIRAERPVLRGAFPDATVGASAELTAAVTSWLAAHGGRPFLLWVHLAAGHDGNATAALAAANRIVQSLSVNYRDESCFVALAGVATPPGTPALLALKFPAVELALAVPEPMVDTPVPADRFADSIRDALRVDDKPPGSLRPLTPDPRTLREP